MARWLRGQSGNPRGRPKKGNAIADLARQQIEKHRLVEKLGSIAARQSEYSDVEVTEQLRAIQMLLAYGYGGPPRAELEAGDGNVVIQVIYAETNQIAIAGAALRPTTSDRTGEAIQRGLLRAPLGENGSGHEQADSPCIAG